MTYLSETPRARWRHGLLSLLALGLAGGVAFGFTACLPGVSYEKVDSGSGGNGGGGGSGGSGGTGGMCSPTPGSCGQGSVLQLGGTGDVEVTDIAPISGTAGVVVVGRFTGSFSVGGQQLSAGAGGVTDGFVVELDGAGQHVASMVLPEVDETSQLFVAFEPNQGEIVVGGSFSQGPHGSCTSASGLFVRRLDLAGDMFLPLYPSELVCIDAAAGTMLTVHDVGVYPGPSFAQIMGSFDGQLDGVTSTGEDGFAIGVAPEGVVDSTFVIEGAGDSAVKGAIPSFPNNEWVLVGDFSGELSISLPNTTPVNETSDGGRDLFVVAYDTFAGNENLRFVKLGLPAGDHRVVGVTHALDEQLITQGVMLVQLDGPLLVQNPNTMINEQGGIATLAMSFNMPIDGQNIPFSMIDYYLLRSTLISPLAIGGDTTRFSLAGHAAGDIAVEHAGAPLGQINAVGCQRDAFVATISGSTLSQAQRCGDGQQQVTAISGRLDGLAAAITVPVNASLDGGAGEQTVSNGADTFLLLQ